MSSLPLKPFADLPVTGTPEPGDSLVAVKASGQTARLTTGGLLSGTFRKVQVPGSSGSAGDESSLSPSRDGFYTFAGGTGPGAGWGKLPRYVANWGDLTPTTRFLRVDSVMVLSPEELGAAWETLTLGLATRTSPGLIKASDSVLVASDGTATVPAATPAQSGLLRLTDTTGIAASQQYVDAGLSRFSEFELKPATATSLGGILSSDSIQVDSTGLAQVPRSARTVYGLVQTAAKAWPVAAEDKPRVVTAETAELIARGVAETKINPPDPAAGTPGVILPMEPLYLSDPQSGLTGVRMATGNSTGVVYTVGDLTGTIGPGDAFVASARAVKTYVDAQASTTTPITPERLPLATPTARGAIKTSSTIRMYQSTELAGAAYVPVAALDTLGVVNVDPGTTGSLSVKVPNVDYMLAAIAGGGVEVPHATDTVYGTTVFRLASGENAANAKAASAAYVDEKVQGISLVWGGGTVTQKSTFAGGLTTPVIASPGLQDVIPYGQVKAMVDAGGGGGGTTAKATTTTLGTMKLGTATVLAGGYPVGFNASDQAFVNVPAATQDTAGVVKVSGPSSSDCYVGVSPTGMLSVSRATSTVYGAIKTGYADPLTSGAKIGINTNGVGIVPLATSSEAGVVRIQGGTYSGTGAVTQACYDGHNPEAVAIRPAMAGFNGCVAGSYNASYHPIEYSSAAPVYVADSLDGYSQSNPMFVPGIHIVAGDVGGQYKFGTVQVGQPNNYPATRIPTSSDEYGRLYVQKSAADFTAGDTLALATKLRIMTYSEYMALAGRRDNSTVYVVKKNGDGTGTAGIYAGSTTIAT